MAGDRFRSGDVPRPGFTDLFEQLGDIAAAQFERFAADVGEPAAAPGLPPPAPPDVERLLAAADRYGVEILPPPPTG
jgi:hypothetical protein